MILMYVFKAIVVLISCVAATCYARLGSGA